MTIASLDQLDPRDLCVLMRVDCNVPLDQRRFITDNTRIRAVLPSVAHVSEGGGKLVLMSHLGRPPGEVRGEYSLRPVADRLAELVTAPVKFAADCVGPDAEAKRRTLRPGEILLLENLRFHPGETTNDPAFATALAACADVYANDAFAAAHRAHASTVAVAERFKRRYAGLLMGRELEHLDALLTYPRRPFTAILGGDKVAGKVAVIRHLLERVDNLLLGGVLAFTFFKVMGLGVGESLVDPDSFAAAAEILALSRGSRGRLILPMDVMIARDFGAGGRPRDVLVSDIPESWQGLDLGPRSTAAFCEVVAGSQAIFWNGPLGVSEIPAFAGGTEALCRAIAAATAKGATSVVGGGDSVAALNLLQLTAGISHISTGGAAALEFIAGRRLPGLDALSDV